MATRVRVLFRFTSHRRVFRVVNPCTCLLSHFCASLNATATGTVITSVTAGDAKDVDCAVTAGQKVRSSTIAVPNCSCSPKAYKTVWGQKTPAVARGKLLFKLADLIERDAEEFAALESLNVGV